ncbi:MAG: hypothetical protein H6Q33_917 [Deltaproteobacteria bacterium]|nr:hypothetical protein [Deltaproteobacteria bacterium]
MFVDVSCKKCGQRKRLDVGQPAVGQPLEEYLRFVLDRLSHQPSFGCFGGHFELSPPVPNFWNVHWDTLGDA